MKVSLRNRFRLAGLNRFSQLMQETEHFLSLASETSCEDCPLWAATQDEDLEEVSAKQRKQVNDTVRLLAYETP
jgi:hypothetical protein